MDPVPEAQPQPTENFVQDQALPPTVETEAPQRPNPLEDSSKIEENYFPENNDNFGNNNAQEQEFNEPRQYRNNRRGGRGRGRGRGGRGGYESRGGRGGRGGYNNRFNDRNNSRGYSNNRDQYQNHNQGGAPQNDGGQPSYDDLIGRVAQPGFKSEFETGNPYDGSATMKHEDNNSQGGSNKGFQGNYSPQVKQNPGEFNPSPDGRSRSPMNGGMNQSPN